MSEPTDVQNRDRPAPDRPSRLPWIVAILASLIALGSIGTLWYKHEDGSPRRWLQLDPAEPDAAFNDLLTPRPIIKPIPAAPPRWGEPHVSVYTFASVKQPPVTLRDLADNGQAHAIDFLAKNTKDEPHTWSQLQEALTNAQSAAAAAKDPFKFERVLVSTVTKGALWSPGDRMVWTRVFVQPINFEFGDYSIDATQNEMDKIANIEATHSRKLALDLSAGVPGAEGSKVDLSPSDETTAKTTQDIDSQYEKLGIDIQRGFLRIIRESGHQGDVAGNALVPLSLITDPATIHKTFPNDANEYTTGGDVALLVTETHLTDNGGRDLDEDTAAITALPQALLPHCPLLARVWMLYEERHIKDRGEFYDEAHQEVELLRKAEMPKDIEIVPADDVSPAVWRLKLLPGAPDQSRTPNANSRTAMQGEMLQGHADEQSPLRDIVFTDYGQASAMAHWIRYHYKEKIGSLSLNYNAGESLFPFKGPQLGSACQPESNVAVEAGVYRARAITEPMAQETPKSK